jgi:hypothetical protein
MKMTVFWDVVPYDLLEIDRRLKDASIMAIALMMNAVSNTEISVSFYETTWHKNPQDGHLHNRSQVYLRVLRISLSISFHRRSPYSYII